MTIQATVFGPHLARAEQYHELLATDGSVRGFIGPREVPRLWERHILNCAVVAELIPEGVSVIDIGSGAGLPGVPLAIARPDLQITLLEPLLKRSVFLSEVKEKLDLKNVTVIRGRAEDKPVHGMHVATSRAVAPLGKLAGWSLPLVRRGGVMLALKGDSAAAEIARDRQEIKRARGGKVEVVSVGKHVLDEPTTVVKIEKLR